MSKAKLRALTLGTKREFKKEIVEIDNVKFELRQPTIKQRGEIQNKSMKLNLSADSEESKATFDMFTFLLCAVIELTYVPGTDEQVFSEEDIPTMQDMPAGSWFDTLSQTASTLCNVKENDVKKLSEETEKKS